MALHIHPSVQTVPDPPPAPRGGLQGALLFVVAVVVLVAVAASLVATTGLARARAFPVPNVSITVDGQFTAAGQAQNFTVNQPVTFVATVFSGRNLTFDWDFGDGSTGTGAQVAHTYTSYANGVTVTLSATDLNGQKASATTTLNILPVPPRAVFTYQVASDNPLIISFNARKSTGTHLTYSWKFGDGSTNLNDPIPQTSHHYQDPGRYTVTLTVVDAASQQASTHQTITISIPLPHAAFTVLAPPGAIQLVEFDASASTGYHLTYSWKFGDGRTVTNDHSPRITIVYTGSGRYTVTLTVTDAFGRTSSVTRTVTPQ